LIYHLGLGEHDDFQHQNVETGLHSQWCLFCYTSFPLIRCKRSAHTCYFCCSWSLAWFLSIIFVQTFCICKFFVKTRKFPEVSKKMGKAIYLDLWNEMKWMYVCMYVCMYWNVLVMLYNELQQTAHFLLYCSYYFIVAFHFPCSYWISIVIFYCKYICSTV
jgi:hypothetical protein